MSYEESNNLDQESQTAQAVNCWVNIFKVSFEMDTDTHDISDEPMYLLNDYLIIHGEKLSSLLISKFNDMI